MDHDLRFATLDVNSRGRDFVCGDIHGSYTCVLRFLEDIKFDFSNDRLIAVGDLVDRGPDSLSCLRLMREPWFFSVAGNHEQLMYGALDGLADCAFLEDAWIRNGGAWALALVDEITDVIAGQLLPHILTVNLAGGTLFHVIHAELPRNQVITDESILNQELVNTIAPHGHGIEIDILWKRSLFYNASYQDLTDRMLKKINKRYEMNKAHYGFSDQLSHIYSGHTVVQRPLRIGGQTNLDTGAYLSYTEKCNWAGLTVTEPASGRFWLVKESSFDEVSCAIATK